MRAMESQAMEKAAILQSQMEEAKTKRNNGSGGKSGVFLKFGKSLGHVIDQVPGVVAEGASIIAQTLTSGLTGLFNGGRKK